MTRLFLIRHGEPETAWGGPVDDPGLSDTGLAQAKEAAGRLLGLGGLRIVSSPMRRCLETAAPYAQRRGQAPAVEPCVSEVASPPGIVDRRAWLAENFPWRGGTPRAWSDMGADLALWRERMLGWTCALGEDCAVFTHFIAINVMVGAALKRDETIVCKPGYASITELAVDRGALSLVRLGEEMRVGGDVR